MISVRKAGNRLRITAQLVDARTDTHIWAEKYDRQFEDVFELQDDENLYRLLDGAHRWHAYREIGETEIPVRVISLNGMNPLLYAAKKAIGPLQLTDKEARETARRVYESDPRLTSVEIGRAIGRSRQPVDIYIADLRAVSEREIDVKIFRMHRLHIPQERMACQLGALQQTVSLHLQQMPGLANPVNTDLSKGFSVPQVAEKHRWPEPLVWSLALEGKDDIQRFKALMWGLLTWDHWNWNDCDRRFGDDWPGRIPAQMIAHILYRRLLAILTWWIVGDQRSEGGDWTAGGQKSAVGDRQRTDGDRRSATA